jgi:hypothetical protein
MTRSYADILKSLHKRLSSDVRQIFAFKRVLTFTAFRLNNRDALRKRRSNDKSSNVFHISSSFRQGQTAIVFAAVHQTVTADSSRSANDSDNEPGLDKSVWVLHTVAAL